MQSELQQIREKFLQYKIDVSLKDLEFIYFKAKLSAATKYYLQLSDQEFAKVIGSLSSGAASSPTALSELVANNDLIDKKEFEYIFQTEFWEFFAEFVVLNVLPEDENSPEFKEIMANLDKLKSESGSILPGLNSAKSDFKNDN